MLEPTKPDPRQGSQHFFTSVPHSLHYAIEWAVDVLQKRALEIASTKVIQQRAWSDTVKITDKDSNQFFLKANFHPEFNEAEVYPLIYAVAKANMPPLIETHASKGFLLLGDHHGQPLGEMPEPEQHIASSLRTYAEIQTRFVEEANLLGQIRRKTSPEAILRQTIAFLQKANSGRDKADRPVTGASSLWLTDHERTSYEEVVIRHRAKLHNILCCTSALPDTINHSDFHPFNIAIREDQSVVLYDWADVTVGPAGLSLSGILPSVGELFTTQPKQTRLHLSLYENYIQSLVQFGYATEETLRRSLPASALGGLLLQTANFSYFPTTEESTHTFVRRQVKAALDELVEILS